MEQGVQDLREGLVTVPALLVSIGAPRLRRAGIEVPRHDLRRPEIRLYQLLCETEPERAYSLYNSLLRRLVSFERALECVR